MGTAPKKPKSMRSIKSGVKSFKRTSKNIEIINRLMKEHKK